MRTKLAAIFAADVVGYSRLMSADETGTLARVQGLLETVMRPMIELHGGRIFKLMGDGVLAEFGSAQGSVGCALEIQRAVERSARAAELEGGAEAAPLRLRIGIHMGDVIGHDGDVYGHGVNLAARVEALAEPGGICISRAVHDEIRDRLPVTLEDRGAVRVKNIARPVQIYGVAPLAGGAWRPASDPRGRAGASRVPRARRLAGVLAAAAALLLAEGSVHSVQAPVVPEAGAEAELAHAGDEIRRVSLDPATGAVMPRTRSNLRAGPGKGYDVVGTAGTGDRLRLTGETRVSGERWLRVEGGPARTGAFIFGPLVEAARDDAPGGIDRVLAELPATGDLQPVALRAEPAMSGPAVAEPDISETASPAAAEPLRLRVSIDFMSGVYTSCLPFGGVDEHRVRTADAKAGENVGAWSRLHLRHGPSDMRVRARARRADGQIHVALLPYSSAWSERDAIRLVLDDRPGARATGYSRRKAHGQMHGCGRLVAYVTRAG